MDRGAASNRLDRFGRIAFNKNRELSQASLDVKREDNSLSDEPIESSQKESELSIKAVPAY